MGHLNLPPRAQQMVIELGNFGLSQKTWSSYRTAKKMWDLCQNDTGSKLELPWSQRESIIFIDWLIHDRKVTSATINSYLAGIAKFHVLNGFEEPKLKTTFIKQLIKGKQNKESIQKRMTGTTGRVAVTLDILETIFKQIKIWQVPSGRKRLVWAVSTIAFFGGVRIHEILAENESFYDPNFTMLRQDVRLTTWKNDNKMVNILEMTIKSPKESKKGKDVVIDIFESENMFCPIFAFRQWLHACRETSQNEPLFREDDGTPLTGRKFNTYLRTLLKDSVDYKSGKITSHSFRSGLATVISTQGLSIKEIKEAGRWNSRAYESYVKLPRAQRALLAEKLANTLK